MQLDNTGLRHPRIYNENYPDWCIITTITASNILFACLILLLNSSCTVQNNEVKDECLEPVKSNEVGKLKHIL